MIKILFVCHGNICRSPMAEFVMKHLVEQASLRDEFFIASAATSTEELGNPVYPPAQRVLAQYGIACRGKTARQICPQDYEDYDWLLAMDRANLRDMVRLWGGDPAHKCHLLLEDPPRQVADPWYTGNFDATWSDVSQGCADLLTRLT